MSAVADSALCRVPGKWLRRMELLGPAVAPVKCFFMHRQQCQGQGRGFEPASFTARELTEMNRLPHIWRPREHFIVVSTGKDPAKLTFTSGSLATHQGENSA